MRDADHLSGRTWAPVDAEQQSREFHAHDGGSTAAVNAPPQGAEPARSRDIAIKVYRAGRSMLVTGGHAPACATLVASNPKRS
jgi:hypothetical protein